MKKTTLILLSSIFYFAIYGQNNVLVFQSDFGLKDGAVSAMKGVSMGVSNQLKIFDITHEIPAYNIWEAAYRLEQTLPYWSVGTVFVSIVDPGVGTNRKSVVAKTKNGQFIVTPNNGTLTLINQSIGIESIREIDETINRLPNSNKSYTFHGRDVYAYTGARLAAGIIKFEQVGKLLPNEIVSIPYKKASFKNNMVEGNISILDIQYGNIWTNITEDIFNQLRLKYGDKAMVSIYNGANLVYEGVMPYCATFGAVSIGKPVLYLNSLLQVSFGINQGDFSSKFKIKSGANWSVKIKKINV